MLELHILENHLNLIKMSNILLINNKIEQKKDLFDRGYDFKVLKVDQTFAKFIYENEVQKWIEFIRGSLKENSIDNLKISGVKM